MNMKQNNTLTPDDDYRDPDGCGCSQDDMEDFVKQIENASNNELAEMIRDLLKEMYKNLPKENNVEAKLCMYIINEAATRLSRL